MRWEAGLVMVCLSCLAGNAQGEERRSFLGYSGLDLAFDGLTASFGTDYTLSPPAPGGAILRFQASQGYSRYTSTLSANGQAGTREQAARLLAGYALEHNGLSLKLLGGLALHQRAAEPLGADSATGSLIGMAIAADLWWTFAERGVLAGHALFATPFQSWSLRLAPGWRTEFGPVIGPEFIGGGHTGSTRLQFGLHLTDIPLGRLRARLSVGQAFDPGGEAKGFYGSLSAWKTF